MKNVTGSMKFILDYARERGESMASIPTDKLAELVEHLRALDRVVIAAESFIDCAGDGVGPWSEDEAEGLGYLSSAVKGAAS